MWLYSEFMGKIRCHLFTLNKNVNANVSNLMSSLLTRFIYYFLFQTYTPCTVTFDLSSTSLVSSAAKEILKCHGHVDVLINNAGISYRGNILDTQVSVQRDVMETNYFGPVALTQGE